MPAQALLPVSAVERFSADRTVPRLAREITKRFLDGRTEQDTVDVAELLVSELVTNAVEASEPGACVTLSLRVVSDLLLIRVVDAAAGAPIAAKPTGAQESGYGLFLVEELSRTYGHVPVGAGKKCSFCTLLLTDDDNTGGSDS